MLTVAAGDVRIVSLPRGPGSMGGGSGGRMGGQACADSCAAVTATKTTNSRRSRRIEDQTPLSIPQLGPARKAPAPAPMSP